MKRLLRLTDFLVKEKRVEVSIELGLREKEASKLFSLIKK